MLGPLPFANGAAAGASRNNCSTGSNSANAVEAAIAIRLTHVIAETANRMGNLDRDENQIAPGSIRDTSIKESISTVRRAYYAWREEN